MSVEGFVDLHGGRRDRGHVPVHLLQSFDEDVQVAVDRPEPGRDQDQEHREHRHQSHDLEDAEEDQQLGAHCWRRNSSWIKASSLISLQHRGRLRQLHDRRGVAGNLGGGCREGLDALVDVL